MGQYNGVVIADICEARFAFSGKVAAVNKKPGEAVKKGESIASLDRKILQTELDRQLADYEKVRAEFEIFNKKNQDDHDDITNFSRQKNQASLNASVKEVELAKFKLDEADLLSPVHGHIIDMEGLATGLFISPASNPVKILNKESLRFQFDVHQGDVRLFTGRVRVTIHLDGIGKEYSGTTMPVVRGNDGLFQIVTELEETNELVPGMKGFARTT